MLDKTFYSDEEWFHFTGYVNSQNTNIWLMENPHAAHETPIHPVKIAVWCAASHHRIAGKIFFENTINSEHCTDIVYEFLLHFTEDKIVNAWF
jgi:hypothetical protein